MGILQKLGLKKYKDHDVYLLASSYCSLLESQLKDYEKIIDSDTSKLEKMLKGGAGAKKCAPYANILADYEYHVDTLEKNLIGLQILKTEAGIRVKNRENNLYERALERYREMYRDANPMYCPSKKLREFGDELGEHSTPLVKNFDDYRKWYLTPNSEGFTRKGLKVYERIKSNIFF